MRRLGAWLLVLLVTGAAAAAQDAPTAPAVPVLYGHAYVDQPFVASPFVRTMVSNSIGAGVASELDFGEIVSPQGDTLLALEGALTVATLAFSYQHALRDWLLAGGSFRLGARTGTEVASLVSTGVTFATSFELGWLARLRQTERSILSASAHIGNTSATYVDLLRWVDEISQGETADLVKSIPALSASVGLHYAWVLNEAVAFTLSGTGTRGESPVSRVEDWFWAGAIGASVNLADRYDVPLGFGISARVDSNPSLEGVDEGAWQAGGFRMAYTGRSDMRVSLTFEASRVPLTRDEYMRVNEFSFDLGYFF